MELITDRETSSSYLQITDILIFCEFSVEINNPKILSSILKL